ncbi:hypothetical protein AgCh_029153 [Apium graveolens]
MKIEEVLPEGYVDILKGRGMIVEGWAPQDRGFKVIKVVVNGDNTMRKKAKALSECERIKMNEEEAISAAVEELKKICTKT